MNTESDQRFRSFFENTPFPISEEDFSKVKAYLDGLRFQDVQDRSQFLDQHPEVVQECLKRVIVLDANQASIDLFEARSKDELLHGMTRTFAEGSYEMFKQELIALYSGDRSFKMEKECLTLKGNRRDIVLSWTVLPGHEKTFSRVLVGIVDITGQKQTERALKDRARQQAAVAELGRIALVGGELTDLMNETASRLASTLDVKFSAILELVPKRNALLLRAGVGWDEGSVGQAVVPAGNGSLAGYALQTNRPVIVEDLRTDARFSENTAARRKGVVSAVCVIIQGGQDPWGALGVHTTQRRGFTRDDVNFLQASANLLADAIARKQMEERLHENESRFVAFMDNLPGLAYMLDSEGRHVFMNRQSEALLQLGRADWQGKTNEVLFPPAVAEQRNRDDQRVLKDGSKLTFEDQMDHGQDKLYWLVNKFPIRSQGETSPYLGCICIDITERKRVERLQSAVYEIARAAIRSSKLEDLFGSVHRIIQKVMPAENFYIALYDAEKELLNFPYYADTEQPPPVPRRARKGLTEYVLRTKESLLCTGEVLKALRDRGEVECIGAACGIWLGVPLIVGKRVIGVMAVQHDSDPEAYGQRELGILKFVSSQIAVAIDRKLREDAVRESEEKLRIIADNSSDHIMLLDQEGTIQFINRTVSGLDGDEVLGKSIYDFIQADEIGATKACFQRVLQSMDPDTYYNQSQGEDGATRHFESRVRPLIRDGEVTGFVVNSSEMTERRLREEALLESETRYRQLVENANDIIYTHDLEGRFTSLNRAGEELTGYSRDELYGMSMSRIVAPEYQQIAREMIAKKVHGEISKTAYPMEILTKDGRRLTVEVSTRLAKIKGKPVGILGIARDLSERMRAEEEKEKLEEQLRQAQKMEAIGTLAGGVAHDFNNILTAIIGYADMILTSLDPDDEWYESIEAIIKAADRASSLTRQLLAFSRRQALNPIVVDANKMIEDMLKMLERLIGEHIDVRFLPAVDLVRIQVDPRQIEQVLLNLAVNARDAMPKGGRLRFETRNVYLKKSESREIRPGSYVEISVSDSGTGMDEEIATRIFEPFFTTKEVGKGTGLGLSTAYGIIRQHEGRISMESEPGRGTTFRILLPGNEETVAKPLLESTAENIPRGRETILLVEDEASLRQILHRTLEKEGYHVLVASRSKQAEKIFKDHSVDLLLTDILMPGGNGPELYERLRESVPDLKVLFISGYTKSAMLDHVTMQPGSILLEKPFRPQELKRKIREVIQQGPAAKPPSN